MNQKTIKLNPKEIESIITLILKQPHYFNKKEKRTNICFNKK